LLSYTNPDLDNNHGLQEICTQYIDDITTQKYIVNPPEVSLQEEETEGLEGNQKHTTRSHTALGHLPRQETHHHQDIHSLFLVSLVLQQLFPYSFFSDTERFTSPTMDRKLPLIV